jgi:hypothetical protein
MGGGDMNFRDIVSKFIFPSKLYLQDPSLAKPYRLAAPGGADLIMEEYTHYFIKQ